MASSARRAMAVLVGLLAVAIGVAATQVPSIAAGGLLHPSRTALYQPRPSGCSSRDFAGEDVTLKGWYCPATTATKRGTVLYLHGVADNRSSATGVINHFVPNGFDVIAYDSRSHGESEGDFCTYGYFEKLDARRVIAGVGAEPVILMGNSLGAAVALQAAAGVDSVRAVVAAEVFSDLETVARERAWFLPDWTVRAAFRVAETQAKFEAATVSPLEAAKRLKVPVLLIHGADDVETLPAHSERVFAALTGPKRLIIVSGSGHNQSLSRRDVWADIDRWLDDAIR
jgi:uncharacterized protein